DFAGLCCAKIPPELSWTHKHARVFRSIVKSMRLSNHGPRMPPLPPTATDRAKQQQGLVLAEVAL
ncbi:MAG: hypothetical protein ACE5EQ_10120, partial [Phycisphaerae bacterium]